MSPLRPIALRALAAQSDDRLVRLIREGHEPAFEEVVRRYREPLIAFAAAIATIDRAEDVVQVSLQRAQKALLRDDAEIRLRPWLFAIVRNDALNTLRDEPRFAEIDPDYGWVPGPEEVVEQRQEFGALMNAVCALPPSQRQALVQREMEGRGHAEIAAQLGTTATAVRGLIFRARTTLRDTMGAVVPLPILRSLLSEGRVAEAVATGGTGAAGLALVGGGTKIGAVAATAVIAVGAGTAIRGEQSTEASSADRESAVVRDDAPSGSSEAPGEIRGSGLPDDPLTPADSEGETGRDDHGRDGGDSDRGDDNDSGQGGSDGDGGGDGSGGSGPSGSGEGGDDPDDTAEETTDDADEAAEEAADAAEDAAKEAEEAAEGAEDAADEDRSGSGSDSSGSGSSGSGLSPEPPEPEDDSSGSGSGQEPEDPDVD